MADEVVPEPEKKTPVWRNPFVLAFVLGVVVLTALPLLQRRFLKAPPPIAPIAPWRLSTVDEGSPFGSEELAGKVYLIAFAADPCDAACVDRQKAFGRGLEHTDDLGDAVRLVSIARTSTAPALRALSGGRWQIVTGPDDEVTRVVAGFHAGWAAFAHTDAGSTLTEQLALPAYGLIDQNGQLRGFWRDDVAGRGNAINGARLLAKYGPAP